MKKDRRREKVSINLLRSEKKRNYEKAFKRGKKAAKLILIYV